MHGSGSRRSLRLRRQASLSTARAPSYLEHPGWAPGTVVLLIALPSFLVTGRALYRERARTLRDGDRTAARLSQVLEEQTPARSAPVRAGPVFLRRAPAAPAVAAERAADVHSRASRGRAPRRPVGQRGVRRVGSTAGFTLGAAPARRASTSKTTAKS